ncbi:RNA polymerase sigma factor [Plantactinospora solaniradicis]|uniref:RNA polymerase sigma factor n=1 Tax=Plantactinospora solaniradicis TaxID=1723736 RepID=A0ABW1KCZ5_9ACTN
MTESLLEDLLPNAIATAEATLRRPSRNRTGVDRLRAALNTMATFDAKRNPDGVYRLAVLLSRLELHAEAERLLDWMAWRTSRGSDAWLTTENVRAILAESRGEPERAIVILDLALRTTTVISVTSAKLHTNLAVLYLEVDERARAARHATAALTAALTSDRPDDWPPELLASAESTALLAIEATATDPPRTAEELAELAETQLALAMRRNRTDLAEAAIELLELATQHLTARLPRTHPDVVRLRDPLTTADDWYANRRWSRPAEPAAATGSAAAADPARRSTRAGPVAEVRTLVERARAGDPEFFGLIYDRYLDTVFRFAYLRSGDRRLAEVLTSDTFRHARSRLGSLPPQGGDLAAWLVGIARTVPDPARAAPRSKAGIPAPDLVSAPAPDLVPGPPPVPVIERITNPALLTAVTNLEPDQRDCVILRFFQDFSVPETARAMDRSEGAVRALQHRAVRALARLAPLGPARPWWTVAHRRAVRLADVLRDILRPRRHDLLRRDRQRAGPPVRSDDERGIDRLMLLGLQLRTIPASCFADPDFRTGLRMALVAASGSGAAPEPRDRSAGIYR